MIRFVDFGRQLDPSGPRLFGFYDTETGRLLRGYRGMTPHATSGWANWFDFEGDFWDNAVVLPIPLMDIKRLCPPWTFGKGELPEDSPGLLRVASDALKEAGHEAMGAAVFEAAAEVERLQAYEASVESIADGSHPAFNPVPTPISPEERADDERRRTPWPHILDPAMMDEFRQRPGRWPQIEEAIRRQVADPRPRDIVVDGKIVGKIGEVPNPE